MCVCVCVCACVWCAWCLVCPQVEPPAKNALQKAFEALTSPKTVDAIIAGLGLFGSLALMVRAGGLSLRVLAGHTRPSHMYTRTRAHSHT